MKLLKNKNIQAGSLYMFGNLSNKAIALIMIPILTRLMSTSEYGILGTYLSWVSIFNVFMGLSLGSSFRSASIDYKNEIKNYAASMYTLSLISSVISVMIIFIISIFIDFQMSNKMLMCCLIQAYMGFVLDSISIKYMMEMKYIKRTIILAIPNLIVAVSSVIIIMNMSTDKYWGRIISYVIVYIVIGLIILFGVFKESKCFINFKYWKYALIYSVPLIFHALSCVILSSSDRIMITRIKGSSEAGIYNLIYNLSMAVKVVTASLESIWIPWFTKKIIDNKKEEINNTVNYYIEIVSVFVCAILMIAPEIVKVVAPSEYWSGINMTVPIIFASYITFLYSISVDLEYIHKSTGYIAKNTLIAALVNFILNLIFIPLFGALAAAYTTVAAYLLSFILHYLHARKLDNELFPISKYIPSLILVLSFCVGAYLFIGYFIIRWLIVIVLATIYIVLVLNSNRKNFIH